MTQTPPELPTEEAVLIRPIEAMPATSRYAIRESEKQHGNQDHTDPCTSAQRPRQHSDASEQHRWQLRTAPETAPADLHKALTADLRSPPADNIEHANRANADGPLLMVNTAHRTARIAMTLHKAIS
ncbi:hypothetical protein WKI65_43590 [Streptomyces sp. MS1.AVA.3]|uniref:hypothetical protein n=1 Tax=Streptomyces decoyicus TaxID=249567 RepID=UPI0030BA4F26